MYNVRLFSILQIGSFTHYGPRLLAELTMQLMSVVFAHQTRALLPQPYAPFAFGLPANISWANNILFASGLAGKNTKEAFSCLAPPTHLIQTVRAASYTTSTVNIIIQSHAPSSHSILYTVSESLSLYAVSLARHHPTNEHRWGDAHKKPQIRKRLRWLTTQRLSVLQTKHKATQHKTLLSRMQANLGQPIMTITPRPTETTATSTMHMHVSVSTCAFRVDNKNHLHV